MGTSTLKAPGLTNLDATPIVRNTAGQGGGSVWPRIDDGWVTAVASDAAGSTYQMVRVPSTAKIKSVIIDSAAQTAGKVDVGVYYATDLSSPLATTTIASNAVSQALFASDVDLAAAVQPTNITNESGTYTPDKRVQPLWQAAGLSTDPGGNLDIVLTVHTTAITTGTGKIGLQVAWVP